MSHLTVTLPGARAVFSSRRGGVSRGPYAELNLGRNTDDDPLAVAANRARLAGELGVELALVRQVHGPRVVWARGKGEPGRGGDGSPIDGGERADGPDADGVVTHARGVAPTVLVADCLPVAVTGPEGVAMLHGGWRGLAAGIISEGVRALGGDVRAAAIGPGARACCYEVGDDVAAAFEPEARRGRNLDLPGIARRRLAAVGVDHVQDCGICTICGDPERWFSHRRDHGVTGRQAGIVWRA